MKIVGCYVYPSSDKETRKFRKEMEKLKKKHEKMKKEQRIRLNMFFIGILTGAMTYQILLNIIRFLILLCL